MAQQGIVAADPTTEPSPGASEVEGPARGGPDSKTELGVVSSGGSTPSAGAGSVDAGPGSDESSGPDQAAASTGRPLPIHSRPPGIRTSLNQPIESISVGVQPGLMTATPEGRSIYVADVMTGTVRVITSVRHAANG